MAERKDFSAEAGSAKVVGTVSSNDIAEPVAPPLGMRAMGPRITFHFVGEWDAETSYVLYDVVRVNGTSYIANKINIAKGVDPETDNNVHWVKWNDPNAQVELLQQTVNVFDGRITEAETKAMNAKADAAEAKKASADNAAAISAESARATAAEAANTAAIEAETARATAAESANTAAIEKLAQKEGSVFESVTQAYIGRIPLNGKTNSGVQSMFLKSDSIAVAIVSNMKDSNQCDVYEVNLETGAITGQFKRDFGHANGACYNPDLNKVLVCPNRDYTVSDQPQVKVMYICNPNNYAIEQTITFPFEPHAVCYDPVTNKSYITGENINPFSIDLYELNVSDWSTRLLGTVPTTLPGIYVPNYSDKSAGTQNVAAYNGHVWYTQGGKGYSLFYEIDVNKMSIIGAKNILPELGAYKMNEIEACCFNSNGDVFCLSSAWGCVHEYAVFSAFPLYGNKIALSTVGNQSDGYNYKCYVIATETITSILADGSWNTPYANFDEALSAVEKGYFSSIYLRDGDMKLDIATILYTNAPINIRCMNQSSVSIGNKQAYVSAPFFIIEGENSNKFTVPSGSHYEFLCNAVSRKMSCVGSFLCETSIQVIGNGCSGATFDGSNYAIAFGSNPDAKFTNFVNLQS